MHTPIALPRSGLLGALLLLLPALASAQEVCDNALDDDADGLVDLNDTLECACGVFLPTGGNSLVTNPSFEEHDCVPGTFSELHCAVDWEQGTEATADYFLNVNNGLWPPELPQPVPDGLGVAGFIITTEYNEYVAACLLTPTIIGLQHTLQMQVAGSSWSGFDSGGVFYGPVDLTVYGSASCPDWPVLTNYDCPVGVGDWVELGSATYTADTTWQTVSIDFIPTVAIRAIMIGGPCSPPNDFVNNGWYPYFWIDQVWMGLTPDVPYPVSTSGSLCQGNAHLSVPTDDQVLGYQWYLDGVALPGQTSESISPSDEGLPGGTYACRLLWPGDSCSLLTYTLTEVPPVPVIVQSGVDLTCLVPGFQPWELAYLWYLNGTLIPGATGSSLVAQENGAYSVVVVTFGDCAGISTEVLVSTVGLSEAGAPPGVSIRTLGDVVEVQRLRDEVVILFDATGRVVAQGRASAGTWRHVLAPVADGLYVLSVGGQRVRLPVVRP